MEPRVATGRNSSRAALILISVSAAMVNFSLTSFDVAFVSFNTWISDSSSTKDPIYRKISVFVIYDWEKNGINLQLMLNERVNYLLILLYDVYLM